MFPRPDVEAVAGNLHVTFLLNFFDELRGACPSASDASLMNLVAASSDTSSLVAMCRGTQVRAAKPMALRARGGVAARM